MDISGIYKEDTGSLIQTKRHLDHISRDNEDRNGLSDFNRMLDADDIKFFNNVVELTCKSKENNDWSNLKSSLMIGYVRALTAEHFYLIVNAAYSNIDCNDQLFQTICDVFELILKLSSYKPSIEQSEHLILSFITRIETNHGLQRLPTLLSIIFSLCVHLSHFDIHNQRQVFDTIIGLSYTLSSNPTINPSCFLSVLRLIIKNSCFMSEEEFDSSQKVFIRYLSSSNWDVCNNSILGLLLIAQVYPKLNVNLLQTKKIQHLIMVVPLESISVCKALADLLSVLINSENDEHYLKGYDIVGRYLPLLRSDFEVIGLSYIKCLGELSKYSSFVISKIIQHRIFNELDPSILSFSTKENVIILMDSLFTKGVHLSDLGLTPLYLYALVKDMEFSNCAIQVLRIMKALLYEGINISDIINIEDLLFSEIPEISMLAHEIQSYLTPELISPFSIANINST